MPLGLLIIGTIFLVAAVRGKHKDLFELLKDDFSGSNNFIYWGLALFAIIGVGYFKPLRPVSNAFLVLVALALFISNQGFFNKFMEQIGATKTPAPNGGLGDTGKSILDAAVSLIK